MFRIQRRVSGVVIAANLMIPGTALYAAETTGTMAQDRVSSWVQAVSSNPANRIPPVPAAGESFTSFTLEPGVRVMVQAPDHPDEKLPVHVVLYLLPNGNTAEQTFGRAKEQNLDWHYNIQHIAAQTRRVRQLLTSHTVITAAVEADTLSWPAWRKAVAGADKRIANMVEEIRERAGTRSATIDFIAHSGGGSFIWGFLNAHDQVPDFVQHIVFIDANYSYSDDDRHGDKMLEWLRRSDEHRLLVFAYDDRKVTVNGKPIVSDTGGTWRATDRMARRLEQDVAFTSGTINDLQTSTALDGHILLARHPNPENKILHTVLVEKNGFVFSVLAGRLAVKQADKIFAENSAYIDEILP